MHFKNVAAAVAFVFTSSAASVAQEQPITVERANQLLAVLGQAQQCISLATMAGDPDEQKRIDEVFNIAGRELVTALFRGQVTINEPWGLPDCLIVPVTLPPPQSSNQTDEAFRVGLRVGSAWSSCYQDVRDDLNEAVPPPQQMTQETMEKWIDDQSFKAQIMMRERGCALVQLPN
ncbi:hypothetical protein [Ruegeria sp. 6PALISEP08]|uniref:hypothetical protein n=1 Tax=Ruegeria sp. 6PALISEP08 TaxID=1225660 RepID=UPI000AF028D3|nr:hypothetical protein [Ruegeria sp. 6PALISEP08]